MTTDKYMNKQAKIILSIVGIAAIVVPAILLMIFSGKTQKEPEIPQGARQLDAQTIKEAADKIPQKPPEFPSPSPATPSAIPTPGGIEIPAGSPSAQ